MQLSGYFRQLKSTFAIDIDFEYNLKEIQRLNNKGPSECYTNIYQNHIACNFSWNHKTWIKITTILKQRVSIVQLSFFKLID